MFSAIIGFFTALPKLVDAVNALIKALNSYQRGLEMERIDRAAEGLKSANTPEELKAAARALQDAIRNL